MKIAIVALALTVLFGLGLTALATPGNHTFMDVKPLASLPAASAKAQRRP